VNVDRGNRSTEYLEKGESMKRSFILISVFCTFFPCVGTAASLSEVVKTYRNAVVFLKVEKVNQTTGAITEVYGTGFVVNKNGHVLTSGHVVASGPGLDVNIRGAIASREGSLESMEVIHENSNFDVALLKFRNTAIERLSVQFGDPWLVDKGATVYAMGFPGKEEWFHTEGTLSGDGPKGSWNTTLVLNTGMSGGPVFNVNGQVVAIVWGGVPGEDIRGINRILPINLLAEPLCVSGISMLNIPKPATVIERSYTINNGQETLGGLTAASRDYAETYTAQPGYKIIDFKFVPVSANNAIGPKIELAPDRESFTARYTLKSGPVFDRWRGWIEGQVLTRQEKK
jgi:Trypsin-like peptidase domain